MMMELLKVWLSIYRPILDSEKLHKPVEEWEIANSMDERANTCDAASKEQMLNVKTVVLSLAVQDTSYLRKVLPLGVVVGLA